MSLKTVSTPHSHGAEEIKHLPLPRLSLKYEKFRLSSPKGYRLIEKTMYDIGQVTPISVSPESDKSYAILDGLKRYHAAKNLHYDSLLCRILQLNVHAQKAAIVQLNHSESAIRVIEESLVISSLYREDALTQPEIAVLFGRHKSWVRGRLSIAERLCDEAVENLRLGLITPGVSKELARLPRGNQPKTLKCILKHCLTTRETKRLVALLLSEPTYAHDKILWFPEPILEARNPPKPSKNEKEEAVEDLMMAATALIEKGVARLQKLAGKPDAQYIPEQERKSLAYRLSAQQQIVSNIITLFTQSSHAHTAH